MYCRHNAISSIQGLCKKKVLYIFQNNASKTSRRAPSFFYIYKVSHVAYFYGGKRWRWRGRKKIESRTSREMDRVKNAHTHTGAYLAFWDPAEGLQHGGLMFQEAVTKRKKRRGEERGKKYKISLLTKRSTPARFSLSVSIHRRRERECAPVRGAREMSAAMLFYVFSRRCSALSVQLGCTPAGLEFLSAPSKAFLMGATNSLIQITLGSIEIKRQTYFLPNYEFQ